MIRKGGVRGRRLFYMLLGLFQLVDLAGQAADDLFCEGHIFRQGLYLGFRGQGFPKKLVPLCENVEFG